METEPSTPSDSTPPAGKADEPVAAVPTSETTPVWAHTKPGVSAEESVDSEVHDTADEALPPPTPIQKGDPDWSAPEGSTNGGAKKAPEWAQTVPTSPGEAIEDEAAEPDGKGARWSEAVAASAPPPSPSGAVPPPNEPAEPAEPDEPAEPAEPAEHAPPIPVAEVTQAPLTEPPRAIAADALKSTWPPRSEGAAAPPQETDIWPPEPPTERAMPAWPPPSELAERAHGSVPGEEPATPAQAIPSWPDSFDQAPAATTEPPPVEPASVAPAPVAPTPPMPPTITPAPAPQPRPQPKAEPAAPTAQVTQPAPPPPAPARPEAAPVAPVTPAQPGTPARPTWAPTAPAASEPAQTAHKEQAPSVQVPAWAPRVPLAAEPGTPTWFSPKEQIPHATAQPAAQPARPEPPPPPAAPVVGGQLPVAPVPPAPAPGVSQAQSGKPTWQVVEQARQAKVSAGPTAEDRSYAEWFAWAKRGGAPASACHAAAQGAFKALSSGKDVTTAVQWATAAMSRPPENVSYARQTYCAWFALANIDLNMDQHRSHAFAGGAVQALDAGMDASAAHAAGLAAAGIR